jgi:hypothetical protein
MSRVTTTRALSTTNNATARALSTTKIAWLPAREAVIALIWERCPRRCSGVTLAADRDSRVFGIVLISSFESNPLVIGQLSVQR